MMVMLAVAFFSWWYGQGWKSVLDSYDTRLKTSGEYFSVKQLLRTLFAPWRRIISYSGTSLADRFKAWGDNIVSRVVGFTVRCIVLFASLLFAVAIIIFTTIELLAWPLLPVLAPILIFVGLLG